MTPIKAVWILWLALHGHIVMQSGIYPDAQHCEQAAATLNATASDLGYFACFRQNVAKPYTY